MTFLLKKKKRMQVLLLRVLWDLHRNGPETDKQCQNLQKKRKKKSTLASQNKPYVRKDSGYIYIKSHG